MITDASDAVDAFTAPQMDSTDYVAGMASMGATAREIAIQVERELDRGNVACDVTRDELAAEIEDRLNHFADEHGCAICGSLINPTAQTEQNRKSAPNKCADCYEDGLC